MMSGQGSSVAHKPGSAGGSSREEYAEGWKRTEVARPLAVWLSVLFCLGLLLVPLADGLLGSWRDPLQKARNGISRIWHCFDAGGFRWSAIVQANNASIGAIEDFETALEDSSAIGKTVRPGVLDGLLHLGGAGSEEAYVGRDGWLFYRPDVDALVMSSAFGVVAAEGITSFAAQLSSRGIRLVVVPVPGKASIHPEQLAPANASFAQPPAASVVSELAAKLSGINTTDHDSASAPVVVDPSGILWSRKNMTGEEQFLRTDSHWAPGAMGLVARAVASAVRATGLALPKEDLMLGKRTVSAVGDTALMHDLPSTSRLLCPQTVEIETVFGVDGKELRPNRSSPVLVLGDSYTNIYSSEDLGWGTSSGFAEHLSHALGCRVDKLARNDAGAKSAREMLAAEDVRNPGWLDGKRVVIWVMAAREFVRGDWSEVDLAAGKQTEQRGFLVLPAGKSVDVEADIKATGPLPSTVSTPYADYLTAVHLTGIRDVSTGRAIGSDALAYIFTMRDRRMMIPPGLAAGDRITLRLSNYAEKADKLDSLNRGELDDPDVMMEEPNFAEWLAPQN